jgi:flagellar hook-associated protein 2
MTTTSSASSGGSILTALGAGSGIDTTSLVKNLVSATYDTKTGAVTAKATANTAKVSSLATLSNGIDAFASALSSLVSGGTLFTQPTSSNPAVLTATTKAGAQIGSLSAQVSVRQVAQAQSIVSGSVSSAATAIGTGTLTIGGGAGMAPTTITIDAGNNTLAGIARTINAQVGGMSASVVSDANGARLVLKGQTGAASAFTVTAGAGSDAGLSALTYGGPGMTLSGATVTSPTLADASTAPVGQGAFTLTTADGTATLAIGAGNDSLDGLAAAVNGANLGLSATVVSDASGARLAITAADGSAPSFTLAPDAGAQAGLSRFAYPASSIGMTRAQAAQDAILRVDGVDVARATNTVDDVIDGVTLKLLSAAPAETVSLGATRPTAAIKQGVSDFVAAYNELHAQIATATAVTTTDADGNVTAGALYNNAGIRQMQAQLTKLTSTILTTGDGPRTLAEIGVSTLKDGTLSLDNAVLTRQLAAYPDAVEAMFNPGQHASSPLIRITSAMGTAKPGTYQLTDIVAPSGGTSASGTIAGRPALTTGSKLYAASLSPASGLVIEADGNVASATITVDLGLGGALQAIRDGLRASGGPLATIGTQLTSEKKDLDDQMTKLTTASQAYADRLTTQFSAMTTRVAAYKATQSYLEQQIAVWTNSKN